MFKNFNSIFFYECTLPIWGKGRGWGYNHAVDIKVDGSGNVFIVGATKHTTQGYNALVVKYNNMGMKQWEYSYQSSGNNDDIATALAIDGSGNSYITGSTITSTDKDVFVLKLDNMGNFGFASTYDLDNFDDGGIFINYVSSSAIEVAAITQDDASAYQLSKLTYNSSGTLQSSHRSNIGYGNMRINDLKAQSSGGYIVCGAVLNGNGDWDFAAYSLSSTMSTNWSYIHDENGYNDEANALVVDGSGNVYATGYISQSNNEPQLAAVKLNGSGTEQWFKTSNLGFNTQSVGQSISTEYGIVLICGNIEDNYFNQNIFNLILSDSNGEVKWSNEIENDGMQRAQNAFLVSNFDFLVTGNEDGSHNFIKRFELMFQDTVVIHDTVFGDYIDKQIILFFKKNVINQEFLNSDEISFGLLDNILSANSFNNLDSIIHDSIDIHNIKASKIFNFREDDSLSITRYGDTIKVPPFYQILTLHLNDDSKLPDLVKDLDSLDSLNTAPFFFASLNTVFYNRCTVNTVDDELINSQPALKGNSNFENGHIYYENARCVEVGEPFVRVAIIDGAINWTSEDFHLDLSKSDYLSSKIVGGNNYTSTMDISRLTTYDDHGTTIAGIVGAIANNGVGIAGIAGGDYQNNNSGISIYNQIIFGQEKGLSKLSDIAPAIADAVYDNPNNNEDLACHILNMSWGDDGINKLKNVSRLFFMEMEFAHANGVVMVCATADKDKKLRSFPDGFYDNWVLCVGASDENRQRYVQSGIDNYGSAYGYNLDIVAPGWINAGFSVRSSGTANFGIYSSTKGGTSWAAPYVAGAAGLMLSHINNANNPDDSRNLAPEDIEFIMEQSAEDLVYDNDNENAPSGYDKWTGHGILRPDKCLSLLNKHNFLIEHYKATTTNSTLIKENELVKICDLMYSSNAAVKADLVYGAKYRADIYEVEIDIEADWPGSEYNIIDEETYAEIEEMGYWLLGSQSNLWYYDSDKKDLFPRQIVFKTTPYKEGNKIKATILGHVFYIRHKRFNQNNLINEWYPHSNDDKHKVAFSVYYSKGIPLSQATVIKESISCFPNPGNGLVELKIPFSRSKIEINDIYGRIVYSNNFSNLIDSNELLDLSHLYNGIYIISVFDENSKRYSLKYNLIK